MLTILYWVGIVLLSLIGLIVFLMLGPVKYKIKLDETNHVCISYWFVLARLKFTGDKLIIRIFGIKLEKWQRFFSIFKKKKPVEADEPESEPEKPKTFLGRIKLFFKKIQNIKELLTSLELKSIISIVIIFAKKMYKKIRPRKIKIVGIIGFDDPADTGIFIGLYEWIAAMLDIRKKIDLTGDFNNKKTELKGYIKGRSTLIGIISPIVWLISQQPIKKLLNKHIIGG